MRSSRLLVLAPFSLLVACSGSGSPTTSDAVASDGDGPTGVVRAVREREVDPVLGVELSDVRAPRASIAPGAPAPGRAVVAQVTLSKAAILGADKTFLYGADYQYSTDLWEAVANGHDVVRFRIVDDALQMVADQTHLFESDVNHPGRLVHAFPIVQQTAKTVTIEIRRGSPLLDAAAAGSSAPAARSSWVRDVQYARGDRLLMIASSLETSTGLVYEFLESVFPRENLVPSTGWDRLLDDPSREPLAGRFHFLTWGNVWLDLPGGRAQTSVASRYDRRPGQTIDWYVTTNVPPEHLADVRTAIEGWNRYSRAMWGTDFVRFQGKLPANVHLGDPRYNVVNWDSMVEAGSAYASEATDPTTGIISHALVYMPVSWSTYGLDYWKNGELSEAPKSGALREAFGKRGVRVSCIRDAAEQISLLGRESPVEFARTVVKGTLFHEIGHTLGLGHNFAASTSPTQYASSVMDYSQLNLDRAAFATVDGWDGQLFEYDRQILSVLYDHGAHVAATDPVMAMCTDAQADDTAGGVDPLCTRYDAGVDPTQRTLDTIALVTDPNALLGTVTSLPTALRRAAAELPPAAGIASLTDAKKALDAMTTSMRGVAGFYLTSGAGSIRYMTQVTAKTLYQHKDGVLPAGYDSAAARARTWQAVLWASHLEALPPATSAALDDAVASAEAWLARTPALLAVPQANRGDQVAAAMSSVRGLRDRLEAVTETSVVTSLRRQVLGSLVRVPTSPFAFVSGPARLDYEQEALGLLERGLTTKVLGKDRPWNERMACATALGSFADTDEGYAVKTRVRAIVAAELAAATDATSRERARQLLAAL